MAEKYRKTTYRIKKKDLFKTDLNKTTHNKFIFQYKLSYDAKHMLKI